MGLLSDLKVRHADNDVPFLLQRGGRLTFQDILAETGIDLSAVRAGDVVALVGDFERKSILTLLRLIDLNVILVPLTKETRADHPYFFEAAHVDIVIEGNCVLRLRTEQSRHPFLDELRRRGNPGLVLFSSGTTGRPKAILHDFDTFLARYRTPRPTLRTLNFLLFDHIGGINTLLHTLYNNGSVVVPSGRTPQSVYQDISDFTVELLPATPTFLRIMLMSGLLDQGAPECLKIITYGTERMDEGTLVQLCNLLPDVNFRQTFGMSELGILRVKSRARDSLWMKIGGEGVETKVVDGVLKIKAQQRMLGYLNAPSPFDEAGWYDTKDIVEHDGEWIRVVGRNSETISVGGLKFLPNEIERVALTHPDIVHAKAIGVENPITGQHVELLIEPKHDTDLSPRVVKEFLKSRLAEHMRPHRIKLGKVSVGHRYKKV